MRSEFDSQLRTMVGWSIWLRNGNYVTFYFFILQKIKIKQLIKIIRKIKKLQNKILQSKKTKTLQQILEKIILTKF